MPNLLKDALLDAIHAHKARVGVIGLGYVGLPFAVEKGKAGFKVLGFDRKPNRVEPGQTGAKATSGMCLPLTWNPW